MNSVVRHEDHDRIEAPDELKDKITITGMGGIDIAAVKRAEAALEELSVNFDQWLEDEVTALGEAHDGLHRHGVGSPDYDELLRVAHDIKGEGETLGYPLATLIAASLCKLLVTPEDRTVIPLSIIDNHVDALRRVMHDKIKTGNHPAARAVADRLVEVVMEFVEHEEARQNQECRDACDA